jgi:hypothetical protein
MQKAREEKWVRGWIDAFVLDLFERYPKLREASVWEREWRGEGYLEVDLTRDDGRTLRGSYVFDGTPVDAERAARHIHRDLDRFFLRHDGGKG